MLPEPSYEHWDFGDFRRMYGEFHDVSAFVEAGPVRLCESGKMFPTRMVDGRRVILIEIEDIDLDEPVDRSDEPIDRPDVPVERADV